MSCDQIHLEEEISGNTAAVEQELLQAEESASSQEISVSHRDLDPPTEEQTEYTSQQEEEENIQKRKEELNLEKKAFLRVMQDFFTTVDKKA